MTLTCPACNGHNVYLLGSLSFLDWFRCQGCGMEFSREHEDEETYDEEELT